MNNGTNDTKLLEILRDFFFSGTQESIQLAYETLKAINNEEPNPTDWTEEEYCYNRLFVGPSAPQAPIVASYYLELAQHYNGTVTSTIRNLYSAIGLRIPDGLNIPEDSLSIELDAYIFLMNKAEHNENAKELAENFTALHLMEWLPLFIKKADRHDNTEAVAYVISTFRDWVESNSVNTY